MLVFRKQFADIPPVKEPDLHVSKRKLLLADDSITIQKVVNLTFADEGIDVVTVGDGDSAMQRIMDDLPDIVLADVNMPGLTGYQICEILRENEATRHIPVILLVGSFEPFDETEASRVGATSYLTKPFQSIRQLVAQVNELIKTPEPEEPSAELVDAKEPEQGQNAVAETSQRSENSQLETFRDDRLFVMGTETIYQKPINTAEAAIQPQEAVLGESDDIDSLYRQSVATNVETDDELIPNFPDVGIDDEMIETSFSASEAETDRLVIQEPSESTPYEGRFEETQDLGGLSNEGFSDERIDEAQSAPVFTEPEAELSGNDHIPTVTDETERLDPAVAEAIVHETARRMDEGQPESHQPEDLAATLPNLNISPMPFSEPRIGEETVRMESRFETKGSGTVEFEGIDLLELPPPGSEPMEITSPGNALEQGSNKQVVSLSPELIEMIAQRVIEKMSEKY